MTLIALTGRRVARCRTWRYVALAWGVQLLMPGARVFTHRGRQLVDDPRGAAYASPDAGSTPLASVPSSDARLPIPALHRAPLRPDPGHPLRPARSRARLVP